MTSTYKDTVIVYGFLSPTDTVQYIKIYKAFIGDGNALDFARVADSIYFKNVLTVQLIRINPGSTSDTFALQRTVIAPMQTGVFAPAPNIVYAISDSIDINSRYRLLIHNRTRDSEIIAETDIPGKPFLAQPAPFTKQIQLQGSAKFEIDWESAIHAKVYDVVLRFHFTEITDGNSIQKYIDWKVGSKIVQDPLVAESFTIIKNNDAFYKYLAAKLSPPAPHTYRLAGKAEIILDAATEDYYYYQKINNPTVGVSQSIPAYTNIHNGMGLFSAKYAYTCAFDLDAASYDYLIHGPYTSMLGFY